MLDISWIREFPAKLDEALAKRGGAAVSAQVLELDALRRSVQTELQELQSRRNRLSKQIGEMMAAKQDAKELMAEVKSLEPQVKALLEREEKLRLELSTLLAVIPNIPADSVPVGKDEEQNKEIERWGDPMPFSYTPKEHDDIACDLGLLNLEASSKISGSRFSWIQGNLARLERAIASYFLDTLIQRGFIEVRVPYLVNQSSMYGTGQLPKFEEDLFKIVGSDKYLIPTSEVPLTNFAKEEIFLKSQLPFKFTSWSPCFRSEAGSSGRDTKGLIRMHQFEKVEMVVLCAEEQAQESFEMMIESARLILKGLELPYRIVSLCTGDLGFGSKMTYDFEVWIPSQNKYREISSCSWCGDFQARRMNARYKVDGGENRFIHTLNGSGLAVGRTLVAILENYQQADGSVIIPEVLRPYMNGLDKLSKS